MRPLTSDAGQTKKIGPPKMTIQTHFDLSHMFERTKTYEIFKNPTKRTRFVIRLLIAGDYENKGYLLKMTKRTQLGNEVLCGIWTCEMSADARSCP
jgi:hypothetical protein